MARRTTFTFRIDSREQEMLARLASELERSQSDAVRLLIREAVKELVETQSQETGREAEMSHADE